MNWERKVFGTQRNEEKKNETRVLRKMKSEGKQDGSGIEVECPRKG